MRLIACIGIIAAGIVLGNLCWELLLWGAHEAGRIVTRAVIATAQRSLLRAPAVAPIVQTESEEVDGRDIRFLEDQARRRASW